MYALSLLSPVIPAEVLASGRRVGHEAELQVALPAELCATAEVVQATRAAHPLGIELRSVQSVARVLRSDVVG